jgi:hypothetical protein
MACHNVRVLAPLLALLIAQADVGAADSSTAAPDSGRSGRVTVDSIEVETRVCGCTAARSGTRLRNSACASLLLAASPRATG